MKIIGIVLILFGGLMIVKNLIDDRKRQVIVLREWIKIIGCWSSWVSNYGYSFEELLLQGKESSLINTLSEAQKISSLNKEKIILYIQQHKHLLMKEKRIIENLVSDLGSSTTDVEKNNILIATEELSELLKTREMATDEFLTLIYKLIPLLCVAVAILLW